MFQNGGSRGVGLWQLVSKSPTDKKMNIEASRNQFIGGKKEVSSIRRQQTNLTFDP